MSSTRERIRAQAWSRQFRVLRQREASDSDEELGSEKKPKHANVDPLFVSDPPPEYLCQICMKVLQQPHVTECCGQHFCKGCLEKWFKKNRRPKKVCPHCRVVSFVHILYKPLQRKINELEVYCSNHNLGCNVTLKLEELNFHLSITNSSGCSFVSIPCPSMCGQEVLRTKMDSHMVEECAKREDICSYCAVSMSHDQLGNHYEVCEEMKVSCPRECGKEMRQGDLKKHEEECPDMPVKCPFSNAGCQVELTRKILDEHVERGASVHLMNLMTSYNTLNARFEASTKDLKDFKSQVAIAVEVIKDTMEKPDSVICKSLDSIESSLRGYYLNSGGDSISFVIPAKVNTWSSPSFTVPPGYSMCVRVKSRIMVTILELLLLCGNMDDQLEWPMDIMKEIYVTLYRPNGQGDMVPMPRSTVCPGSLRCKDQTEVVMEKQTFYHSGPRATYVIIVLGHGN